MQFVGATCQLGQVRQKALCSEMAEPRFGRELQDTTAGPTLYQTSFPQIVIERARKVGSRVQNTREVTITDLV